MFTSRLKLFVILLFLVSASIPHASFAQSAEDLSALKNIINTNTLQNAIDSANTTLDPEESQTLAPESPQDPVVKKDPYENTKKAADETKSLTNESIDATLGFIARARAKLNIWRKEKLVSWQVILDEKRSLYDTVKKAKEAQETRDPDILPEPVPESEVPTDYFSIPVLLFITVLGLEIALLILGTPVIFFAVVIMLALWIMRTVLRIIAT